MGWTFLHRHKYVGYSLPVTLHLQNCLSGNCSSASQYLHLLRCLFSAWKDNLRTMLRIKVSTGSFSLKQQVKSVNCITYQHHFPGRHSAQSTFQIQLLFHVGLNKKKSTVCGLNNKWYCSWCLIFRKLEERGVRRIRECDGSGKEDSNQCFPATFYHF